MMRNIESTMQYPMMLQRLGWRSLEIKSMNWRIH